METKTWTRKANAEAAVKKFMEKVAGDGLIPEELEITGVEAADISYGAQASAYAVKVFVTGTKEDVTRMEEVLAGTASVEAEVTGAVEEENAPTGHPSVSPDDPDGEPKQRRMQNERQSAIPKTAKLTVVGRKLADNPYRKGSRSYKAFELIQNNPEITRADFEKRGGRVRTLTEEVKAGRVRVK